MRILIFLISLCAAGGAGWLTLNMNQRNSDEQTALLPAVIGGRVDAGWHGREAACAEPAGRDAGGRRG